jgi:cation transport ATPase
MRRSAAAEAASGHVLRVLALAVACTCRLCPPAMREVRVAGELASTLNPKWTSWSKPLIDELAGVVALADVPVLSVVRLPGATVVWVGVAGEAAGVVAVADVPRRDAAEAVGALRAAGMHCAMLTGDSEGAARAVAAAVGLAPEDVHAALLPEGKLEVVG